MESPYEHLWSLPERVLDPKLDELDGVLEGARAPTWVVVWTDVDAWDLDAAGRIVDTLAMRYRHAADVRGHQIWRRLPEDRHAAVR
jgi:hypothetical protein